MIKTYTFTGLVALIMLAACGQNTSDDAALSQTEQAVEAVETEVATVQRQLETIAPTVEYTAAAPKLIAATVYADWCGSCKTLDPKIKAVQAANVFDDLIFVTLDYTAKDDAAFFAAADSAGIGEAVRAHLAGGVKTGQVILVDVDDNASVGTITKEMDSAGIVTALKSALEAA